MDVREKTASKKRLIDAKEGKKVFSAIAQPAEYKGVLHMVVPISEIDKLPTVDSVKVVKCRECKHFRNYGKTSLFINGKNIKAGWCQRRIRYDEEYRMTADDFCSYGERKEGSD